MADMLAETLRAILGNDDKARKEAEARFTDARKTSPAATVGALFQLLAGNFEEPIKEQGAVLLRQCLSKVKEEGSTWSSLDVATQVQCKAQLLQLFEAEQLQKVRKKIADAVQSLGNQTIDIAEGQRPNNVEVWPELIPTLMRIILDTGKDGGVRGDALWAVKELVTSIWPVIMVNAMQTGHLLKVCLADANDKVCCEAACLLCGLLDTLDEMSDKQVFVSLVGDFCAVLQKLASSADNKMINELLQAFEVGSNSADFWKDSFLGPMMPMLSTIAKSHPEDETKRLALEVIITFCEHKPKAVAKAPPIIEQTLEICVQFLSTLDDDLDEWAQEDDEQGEDEENFKNGKEVVDRLCRALHKVEKFPVILEILKPAMTKLLQTGEWKHTVAGITILSQIVEYVDEEGVVAQMASVLKGQLTSSHIRVRHAAWTAVAQFAEDQADCVTEESMAQQLLPAFMTGLDDSCERVCLRSMEAFQLYGQECEREVLEPFVQPMMEKLGVKLQGSNIAAQKKAITFIAVLAGQVGDGFAQYYDSLMPLLKRIVEVMAHKTEERTMLGKAFECISLLARAVGPAKFSADAQGIMQAMIAATQLPNLPNNDPVKEYMLQASQRICETMKGDFLPYVQHLLPGILEKLTLAPKEWNNENRDSLDEDGEVNLTITQENGQVKVLVMSTSEIEDLSNALECVHTYVEELGKLYAPFVPDTAKACLPVFDFSMGEEIRDLAFETWGQLCKSARDGGQADVLGQLVQEFLKINLPKIESSVTTQDAVDVEALKTRADGIKVCLQKAGPGVLNAAQVKHICQVALAALETSFRRREADKKPATAQTDEDDAEEDDEEDEIAFRVSCCEIAGALMEHHPDIFVAEALSLCMPVVVQFIPPATPTKDRKLAHYLACDFVDHLGSRVTAQWPQFMPLILADIMHQDPELRQPACYLVACAAKDPAFAPFAVDTAQKLAEVVTQTRGREKKKSDKHAQAVADNALTAIVELLMHHSVTLASSAAQLWGVWLKGLPCQEDDDEGKKNHQALVRMVQSEKQEVIGEGGANMPQILAILIDVYKGDMASEETSKAIGQMLLAFGARLEQFSSALKEKQRKKLMRIIREAQSA